MAPAIKAGCSGWGGGDVPASSLLFLGAPGGAWKDWFAAFGGTLPARFVATFDDSETLHRAAAEGLGVALGRMTLARPLVDAGRLVPLFPQRLKAGFAHYLVYPPRSAGHSGLQALRGWLLEEAGADTGLTPSVRGKRRR